MSGWSPVVAMVDIGMWILKLLGVLGGAAVGALLGGLFLRLCVRPISKPLPRRRLRVMQLLGAAALGYLVWLWVTGTGGGGLGWGGIGLGGGAGPGGSGSTATTASTAATRKEPAVVPTARSLVPSDRLRVEILGGKRVQEQRFYLLEGQELPWTLTELRPVIQERQRQKDQAPLRTIEIVIYENSVAKDHPAVRDLERWAREHDLTVTLSFPKREAPE